MALGTVIVFPNRKLKLYPTIHGNLLLPFIDLEEDEKLPLFWTIESQVFMICRSTTS